MANNLTPEALYEFANKARAAQKAADEAAEKTSHRLFISDEGIDSIGIGDPKAAITFIISDRHKVHPSQIHVIRQEKTIDGTTTTYSITNQRAADHAELAKLRAANESLNKALELIGKELGEAKTRIQELESEIADAKAHIDETTNDLYNNNPLEKLLPPRDYQTSLMEYIESQKHAARQAEMLDMLERMTAPPIPSAPHKIQGLSNARMYIDEYAELERKIAKHKG